MANYGYRATALSAAIAAALGTAPPAFAQDDQGIEEVIVTGSHIRRTQYEGKAPIQIVDAASIELAGAAQPVDVLKELTVNSGSQFYNETNDRAGVSQFNIRNLGLGSTLTLLNGRRVGIAPVADADGSDFVDINQFPLAMIERIEVLTDGASATYGSQAVAGVANIITRKGFEGFEISGGYADGKIDAWNLNLAAGSQFDKGGFNVYATYYEQDHIERSEFDWMVNRLHGAGNLANSRFISSTGSPGTYRRATLDPVNGEARDVSGADNTPDPDCLAAGGVFRSPTDTICRYDFADQVSVISAEERFQVFTEFDWEFNDSVRYYAEMSFSNNVILRDNGGATLNTGRANGGGFTILPTHPFNFFIEDPNNPEALVYIGPDAWDDSIHTAATLRATARPLGKEVNNNALTDQIHRELNYQRILNGLEFDLPGEWRLDFSHMWAKSSRTTDDGHNYRSSVFQDLVRDGQWNPFGTRLADPTLVSPKQVCTTPGQLNCTTNPGAVAATSQTVQDLWDQRSSSQSRIEENIVELVASGDLFGFGDNVVSAAFGAQYRQTEIDIVPDSLSAAGEGNEQGLSAYIEGDQSVYAVYGEAVVPIGDFVELQLAVRYEDYGDVDTTDPKLAFEWSPNDWLGFRGSWGTSFQAPTVRQTASASSSAFLDDPASPTGPGGSLRCFDNGLNNNVTVTVKGAPDLIPQQADSYTFGVVFQTDQFRASVDYWNFDYTDLIAQEEGAQAVVENDCLDDGIPNDPRVIRDAGGQLREVITQFVNIGSVQTDGIDINADYRMDLGSASFLFDVGATFVNKFDVDTSGDGVVDFDGVGSRNFLNSFSTMPEIRGNLGGTMFLGNHTANLTARYIDGYRNDQGNNGPVESYTTLDAQYSYAFSGLIGEGETVLTLGINNLMDEDPPALRVRDDDGNVIPQISPDGSYNTGWIDRPGYDDRAGVDLRGRVVYVRFKHAF